MEVLPDFICFALLKDQGYLLLDIIKIIILKQVVLFADIINIVQPLLERRQGHLGAQLLQFRHRVVIGKRVTAHVDFADDADFRLGLGVVGLDFIKPLDGILGEILNVAFLVRR